MISHYQKFIARIRSFPLSSQERGVGVRSSARYPILDARCRIMVDTAQAPLPDPLSSQERGLGVRLFSRFHKKTIVS